MTDHLWQRDAADLAPAIASGSLNASDVMASVVERMRAENPRLNAVVRDFGDDATSAATAADELRERGEPLGPLHGVPVTIKINIDVAGQPTDNGVPAFDGIIAPGDAPVVRNLQRAGAIIFGRTNAPELSMRLTTDNPLHGRTLNPWDPAASPGGSSGGAGAAAAAGIGPIHHGNDIGGSLRMPAFACGVTTIKPTQGRLPAYNPSAAAERGLLSALMSSQGIIARSVADVRLVTRVMAQRDPRDPLHAPVPWEIPGPAGPVKVAVTTNGHGYPVHPEIVAGVERAAAALADAGYAVAEAEPPPVLEAAKGWFSAGITELKLTLDDAVRAFGSDDLKAVFDQFYAHGEILDLAGYRLGLSERTRMVREWLVFLEENPVVLSPYFLRPTVPYDYDLQGDEASQDLLGALVYSVGLNFLGLPAGVVPVGFAGGLPAGVQLVGSRFRENLVLDAMEAIELRVGRLTPQLWAREAATR